MKKNREKGTVHAGLFKGFPEAQDKRAILYKSKRRRFDIRQRLEHPSKGVQGLNFEKDTYPFPSALPTWRKGLRFYKIK